MSTGLLPPRDDGVIIRETVPGEGREVQRILLAADPDRPHNIAPTPMLVDQPNLFEGWFVRTLVAVEPGGRLVGALIVGPAAKWLSTHRSIVSEAELRRIAVQFLAVMVMAVVPDRRRRGVGRALLAATEGVLPKECGLLVLDYDPAVDGLAKFYRGAGYTIAGPDECIALVHDGRELPYAAESGSRLAFKPLDPSVMDDRATAEGEHSQQSNPVGHHPRQDHRSPA